MNAKILHAHFDGEQIVLDKPLKLKPNTKLFLTILPEPFLDQECVEVQEGSESRLRMSIKGLENAYGKDEVEYSLNLLKDPYREYKRRGCRTYADNVSNIRRFVLVISNLIKFFSMISSIC